MKIVLLKEHNGDKEGSVHDVTEELANYLVRCNVASYTEASAPVPPKPKAPNKVKKTKELKTTLEKK
jgi:hypothetical protein